MAGLFSRRRMMSLFGLGSAAGVSGYGLGAGASASQSTPLAKRSTTEDLRAALDELPAADVHCHSFAAHSVRMTERMFVAELSLGVWMLNAWFPQAWSAWKNGTAAERARIDKEHGIEKHLDEAVFQMQTTSFVDYLVKEMATFFKCKPTLRDVVGARNEYMGGKPWGYVNDLFADAKLQDLFVQGGGGAGFDRKSTGGIGVGYYAAPVANMNELRQSLKCRVFHVPAAGAGALLNQDISLDELVKRYTESMKTEVTKYDAVGFKTGIAKTVGADVMPLTHEEAEQAWNEFKRLSPTERQKLRERSGLRLECHKKLEHYLLWQSLEVCYQLDVPMHIHAGNGEYQDLLSSHYPYKLENVIRYPVEFPQKPVKIVLLHAGYPHVGEAAYLAHIFPNTWFSMCLMNPIANRGLHERMLGVLETAPMSKVLMGSDAYNVPEMQYVAAKWGRRYLASALAVFVDEGILTRDEAIARGRMMLLDNVHRLHKTNPAKDSPAKRTD